MGWRQVALIWCGLATTTANSMDCAGSLELLVLGQSQIANAIQGSSWVPPNIKQLQQRVQDTSSDIYLAYEDNDLNGLAPLVRSHLRGYLKDSQMYPPTLVELTLGTDDLAE